VRHAVRRHGGPGAPGAGRSPCACATGPGCAGENSWRSRTRTSSSNRPGSCTCAAPSNSRPADPLTPIPFAAQGPSPAPRRRQRPLRIPDRPRRVRHGHVPRRVHLGTETGVTALHLGLAPLSLRKRPDIRNLRPWVNGALALGATAIAARRRRAERAHRHVRD
jgi:hypothetical protein